MFPVYFRTGEKHRCYHPASETRTAYFTEIRNILNGYHEVHQYGYEFGHVYRHEYDAGEHFLHCYNSIRGTEAYGGDSRDFDWLDTADAKAAVKAWKGKPTDILPLLARRKIIEKAVAVKMKRQNRK
jgi:hypothetical protein